MTDRTDSGARWQTSSAGRTVAFVHTVPGLAPVFEDVARDRVAAVTTRHIVDEELFGTATAEPGLAFDRAVTTLQRHVDSAVDGGADAVVVTCSTLGPATDVVAATRQVPVIRVDRPMARRAVGYRRVGLLATLESNRAASRAVIERVAAEQGTTVEVVDRLCDGAFDHLKAGDQARHDEAIRTVAADLAGQVDVLVLAQASMANAASLIGGPVPVLTSPAAAVEEAGEVLARGPRPGPPLKREVGISQLRIYRIRPGLMADWLPFFHQTLVPLHHLVGIPVPAAWVNTEDPDEFVWIRQFRSRESVSDQERQFFSTAPRVALGDVRGRYVESLQVRLLTGTVSGAA
ncbi:NIPSNAP protein [Micromonospora pallida]|uniref:NIPSNAP protein n=1 Tax=Micromonospora pallida TaxID=145854 RepID=A0A1C6RX15_9ACTN|nr:aspartate/glutamate racemase family protein [Micromonospora pallida]SCL21774.1 NIPSNAP protein [Micromonospora pallida]